MVTRKLHSLFASYIKGGSLEESRHGGGWPVHYPRGVRGSQACDLNFGFAIEKGDARWLAIAVFAGQAPDQFMLPTA